MQSCTTSLRLSNEYWISKGNSLYSGSSLVATFTGTSLFFRLLKFKPHIDVRNAVF